MRKAKTLGIIAVIAVIGLMAINCDNGTLPGDNDSIVRSRYQTVPYSSPDFGKSAVGGDPYVLVSSGKAHDSSVDYYLYYMGYVKSVPISYKTAYEYNGTTPITLTYEKSWVTEEAITESMTTAKEKTWNVNASATAGVEVGGQAGIAPFASTAVKVSVSATIGGGYGETISTSNTYETSKTKTEGESESITVTVGEHGESAGIYRYALFGTTDVYCLFTVHPVSRKILDIDVKNLARVASYSWGIDYDGVGGAFGKTGTGKLFEVPDIDFAEIDSPTNFLEAPPAPPPPETIKTTFSNWTENKKTEATKSRGNDDISSKKNEKTKWELTVNNIRLINERSDGTYSDVSMDFAYTVSEDKSDWTTLTMNVSHTFSIADRKVIALEGPKESTRSGSISGENHNTNKLGDWNDGVIRSAWGRVDGDGGDKNNISFNAQIHLEFTEKNPAYKPPEA